MSFDVFLQASDATPDGPDFDQAVEVVLASLGAQRNGVVVVLRDGGGFEWFDGMAALRGLTPGTCDVLFAIAEATASFILPTDGKDRALRTPGNPGQPPEDFLPIEPVGDAMALYAALAPAFETWSDYRDQALADPPPRKKSWLSQLFSRP
ncbi:hypothetical protein CFHF_14765 [Caulobacter flavus]|jgi:hypothetical protein|uniref:Uncharacterized protein n=1 Tax=Caulobacter flavus TaxID=1679497 RepID=A0A2N5CRU3_9CAUL|nr:hypothetical protein [Caulobacter flavus]AYV46401.1 hypothetical protein C1707_09080 [Caulobacter flavus]PLR12698.1 hypothetical protein CFHF_14765 [Caulobacter flavus]